MDTLKMLTLAVAILLGRLVEPDGENTPGVSPQLTGGELSSVQAVTATLGSLEPSASLQKITFGTNRGKTRVLGHAHRTPADRLSRERIN